MFDSFDIKYTDGLELDGAFLLRTLITDVPLNFMERMQMI